MHPALTTAPGPRWLCRHLLDSRRIQQVGQARPVDLQVLRADGLLDWKEPSAKRPTPTTWRTQPAEGRPFEMGRPAPSCQHHAGVASARGTSVALQLP